MRRGCCINQPTGHLPAVVPAMLGKSASGNWERVTALMMFPSDLCTPTTASTFENPLPQDPQNSHQCTWPQWGATTALSPRLQCVITLHCSTQKQLHAIIPTGGSEQAEHSQNILQSVLGAVPTVTALKTAHACENIFGCIYLSPPHPF